MSDVAHKWQKACEAFNKFKHLRNSTDYPRIEEVCCKLRIAIEQYENAVFETEGGKRFQEERMRVIFSIAAESLNEMCSLKEDADEV